MRLSIVARKQKSWWNSLTILPGGHNTFTLPVRDAQNPSPDYLICAFYNVESSALDVNSASFHKC